MRVSRPVGGPRQVLYHVQSVAPTQLGALSLVGKRLTVHTHTHTDASSPADANNVPDVENLTHSSNRGTGMGGQSANEPTLVDDCSIFSSDYQVMTLDS
jgi:hypothetical protein